MQSVYTQLSLNVRWTWSNCTASEFLPASRVLLINDKIFHAKQIAEL